jgi:hypothetical protein
VKLLAQIVIVSSLASGLCSAPVLNMTITSTELVATGGEVVAYFAGQTAGWDSVLYLTSPTVVGPFFQNHSTEPGEKLSLGNFAPGEVLHFRLDVSTGDSFHSGPASGNPDGVVHVARAAWVPMDVMPVHGIVMGFEDLTGGGDEDYDDNVIVLTGVAEVPPQTP